MKFNNRITITRTGAVAQDAGGGLIAGAVTTFEKWANVENRTGNLQKSSGREWSYDYKITLRYTPSNIERSSDNVTFDGNKMSIQSVSFEDEGGKRFVILRCSRHE